MAALRLLAPGSPDTVFPLDRGVTLIGKAVGCDLRLPDSPVSKEHARIERRTEGYYIEDLASTNGTRVSGEKLIGCRMLEDGDIIEIINYRLEFMSNDLIPPGSVTILGTIDTLATTGRLAANSRAHERLRVIMEVGRDLVGVLDPDAVLERALTALLRIFPQAERAIALFRDEPSDVPIIRASQVRHPDVVRATASRAIYDVVTSHGQAVLCEDVCGDGRFRQSKSVEEAQVRTMMCAPLWGNGPRPVGIIQVDTRDERSRFSPDDLDFLVAVCTPVGLAVENARLHEVELVKEKMDQEARDARTVQGSFIPEPPNVAGYEFWQDYEPAQSVGGDYFDYRPLADAGADGEQVKGRSWAIALGDVMGKGMPAALLMAWLSSEVRLLLQAEPDPARVIERLNRELCEHNAAEKFVTFMLVVVDAERHGLTVVNAGHMGPMVRRSDGRVEVIGQDQAGLLLGVMDDVRYETVSTPLGPDDVVVLYTDGVTEAMSPDGRQLGIARLESTLRAAPRGAAKVGEAIREAVRRHAAGRDQYDDITLLCFGRT
jgi:serine phosphatase RsbU (regulator of sigma subunit)/pSer/pThr/pTyr-binding forkhead associated (FHA) protein